MGVSAKTVHRVLVRAGPKRVCRGRAGGPPSAMRRVGPGELLHVDIKVLPSLRNARYDYEFAAVDDFSREAVVTIATEQTSAAATTFLELVLAVPCRIASKRS